MSEDFGNEEEKFDFTAEGESLDYISPDQARVLAMGTARQTPGDYGRRLIDVAMAYEVVEAGDTEDLYVITLSVRPRGTFSGRPGREQFFVAKEGSIEHRQVLEFPSGGRKLPGGVMAGAAVAGAAVAVVGIIVVGVIIMIGGGTTVVETKLVLPAEPRRCPPVFPESRFSRPSRKPGRRLYPLPPLARLRLPRLKPRRRLYPRQRRRQEAGRRRR